MIFDAMTEESILNTLARILKETYRANELFLSYAAFQKMLVHKDAVTMSKEAFVQRLDDLVVRGMLESVHDSRNRRMYSLPADGSRCLCTPEPAKVCETIKEATSAGPVEAGALATRVCPKQTVSVVVTVLKAVGLLRVSEGRPARLTWEPEQEQALKQLASTVAEKQALEQRLAAISEEHLLHPGHSSS
jgi:hypothetical protein